MTIRADIDRAMSEAVKPGRLVLRMGLPALQALAADMHSDVLPAHYRGLEIQRVGSPPNPFQPGDADTFNGWELVRA